jgi:gentisate 1,2-dioxygenase
MKATLEELLKEILKELLKEIKTDFKYEEKRAVNSAQWDWQLVLAVITAIGTLLAGIAAITPLLKLSPAPAPTPTQNVPKLPQTRQPLN